MEILYFHVLLGSSLDQALPPCLSLGQLRVFLCALSDTPAISLIAQSEKNESAKVLEDFRPLYRAKTRQYANFQKSIFDTYIGCTVDEF